MGSFTTPCFSFVHYFISHGVHISLHILALIYVRHIHPPFAMRPLNLGTHHTGQALCHWVRPPSFVYFYLETWLPRLPGLTVNLLCNPGRSYHSPSQPCRQLEGRLLPPCLSLPLIISKLKKIFVHLRHAHIVHTICVPNRREGNSGLLPVWRLCACRVFTPSGYNHVSASSLSILTALPKRCFCFLCYMFLTLSWVPVTRLWRGTHPSFQVRSYDA